MQKITTALIAAGALMTLLLPAGLAAPKTTPLPQFGVTLGMDRTAYPAPTAGKPALLHATLTLFNHSSVPLKVTERGHQFDWQIVDARGQVVWDYARGKMFAHFVRLRTLSRGELSFPVDIPLQNQDGTPLPAGEYILRGSLTTNGASASAGFSVTAGNGH